MKPLPEDHPRGKSTKTRHLSDRSCMFRVQLLVRDPKLPQTGDIKVAFPLKLQRVVVRKQSANIKYVFNKKM